MIIENKIIEIAFTAAASAATTLIALLKLFYGSISRLNDKIDALAKSIVDLDKCLAVQAALFETCQKERCKYGNHRDEEVN